MQTIQQLSDRLYYLPPYPKTDRPILAAVVGDTHTLIIDAGNSAEHAKLFKQQLSAHEIYGDLLALTHWHWDHVFGLQEMNLPSVANNLTFQGIQNLQRYSWDDQALDRRVEQGIEIPFCADAIKLEFGDERNIFIPDPTLTFDQQIKLNLGGVSCMIEHVGGDHSPDSTLIYIPEEKMLFLGDCLYANMYAEKWHYTTENITILLEKIDEFDAETFFLSHHPAPLNKNEFSSFQSLMRMCARLAEKHQGEPDSMIREMVSLLQRDLNEEEQEILGYFVNGIRI
ncbi:MULTISPECIES: MBL fold metallo-hydrolase [Allobacillus]|uniref:MBL fold metallo-hydrolase n=1 Tax=Allobacillus salarius TaxID=1955272 RepID=A0A556PDP1_9BACI|nr:MBL fold metallo-hydrolase [Allobacillus salarius]TSJ62516.1 MBL fold metallo-hydrolase [Allobacillus salarius]